MRLEEWIEQAKRLGASDLHLEAGLPPTVRVRGTLRPMGEPVSAPSLLALVQQVIGEQAWPEFREQRSFDLATVVAGVRCRINALHSMRGVGLAVRLLPTASPSLASLNLHPDLKRLALQAHGLLLVSGATGSGKSSTLAALLQEINLAQPRHILTIEQPIEFALRPRLCFIRQREVGRDTPSFDQALRDALREDPDVIMVGELREPETIRLTLNAAETGHLVLATLHSSTVAEALQRVVLAFPAEQQPSIANQLADCLVAVICQQLTYRADQDLRVPECEILVSTSGARGVIRQQEFFKLPSVLETGGREGNWALSRYQRWLESKTTWVRPSDEPAGPGEPAEEAFRPPLEPLPSSRRVPPGSSPHPGFPSAPRRAEARPAPPPEEDGVLVIEAPEGDAAQILRQMSRR